MAISLGEDETMKVYCKKCRYYLSGTWSLRRCIAPDNIYEMDTPRAREKRYRQTLEEKNENNDCPSYSRDRREIYFCLGAILLAVAVCGLLLLPWTIV